MLLCCPSLFLKAHQSGLAALALNASGSLLATASESGTVTRKEESCQETIVAFDI